MDWSNTEVVPAFCGVCLRYGFITGEAVIEGRLGTETGAKEGPGRERDGVGGWLGGGGERERERERE